MDPSDKNRLWSLLSEERSIRFEVQNKALQLNKERSDQPKAKSDEENKNVEIYTEIDTSPITSPENIRQTRGRLSRLLLSNRKIRSSEDDPSAGGKGDSFIPFIRDNVTLREEKGNKSKGSVRFHEPKSLISQSRPLDFVRPAPEFKPARVTRSLSPTPSKLNMYRLKMRSFDDDTDSLYNHRLSRSVRRPDSAQKRRQETSFSTILPIRTVSLDSPVVKATKSTLPSKPREKNNESSGELDFNKMKDSIRRPMKAGIDDRAVMAMEMDAFVRAQQNLSSLISRIEDINSEDSIYTLVGAFAEIFSPIGCSRIVLYKTHNSGSGPIESSQELVHILPDGRNVPLDSKISSCIIRAVHIKSSGNLSAQIDAIFSSMATISPQSVHWNEFCTAASVREDEVCDSWRCILSVPIHVGGKVAAIALVTVDRSNSIIFDSVGTNSSYHTSHSKAKWQDIMALQLLQQLKYYLERKIVSVQNHAALGSMNRDLTLLAKKEFIHAQMLPVLQSLQLFNASVNGVVSSMLHAVNKLGVAICGDMNEVSSIQGHRQQQQQQQQQHPCWMLIEQYGSSPYGQSVNIFSVTGSGDERQWQNKLHVRPIKVDSKLKMLVADDIFGGKMMHAKTVNHVSQEDIDHLQMGQGDYDSNFSRLSSNCAMVVVPFITPLHVSNGSIQLYDSSHHSVRCALCFEVPLMNDSIRRNHMTQDIHDDYLAQKYAEHIVSQSIPTLTKLQSDTNTALQAKFQQVLRIVHHASPLRDPAMDSKGSIKNGWMHLLQFADAVQSEQVSKCFGVRRTALLMSNAFLSELDFQQAYPAEHREDYDYISPNHISSSSEGILRVSSRRNSIIFTQSIDAAFQTIAACNADLGTDSWLQELFNGNAVLFSADAVESGTSPQSQHDKSAAKLKALVGSVDSSAVSAVLLPLRSAMGLCILILIDKVNEVPHDKHEPAPYSTLRDQNSAIAHHDCLFSDFYIQTIQKSGVCGDLIDALHNMRTVTLNEIRYSQEKTEREAKIEAWHQSTEEKALQIRKLESRFEKLLMIIPKYSKREILHNFLRRWKLFVSNRVLAVRNKKFSLLLDGVKELIKVKIDCKEADLQQKYCSIFDRRLGMIFPLDTVAMTCDEVDTSDSHEGFVGVEQDLDDSYSQHSIRKSVLWGTVSCTHHIQLAHRSKTGGIDNSAHTIASVSVTRKSTSVSSYMRFEPEEVSLFHEFCGVASDVYSALHRGVQDDYVPGHARSLIFPMLREIVPAVLPSDSSLLGKGSEGAKVHQTARTDCILSLLSRWLKRLTNAEIVAINLRTNGVAEGALHCTSEDSNIDYSHLLDTDRSLRELFQTEAISSDHNHFRLVLKADDLATAPSSANEYKSSRLESDIRIHFPHNRSTPISDEQISAVEVVSYLFVYSLRNSRSHQKLVSESASLRAEVDTLSEKLSSALREVSLLGASDSILKFRLSAAVSAQEFMNEIDTLESLPDLARYVSNMIPRLFGTESAVLILKDFAFASNLSSKPTAYEYESSLLHGSSQTASRVDDQEKFFVVLPLNDDDSDNSKLENLGKRKALTASKLVKIDNFFHHRASIQSKIELRHPISIKSRKKDSHLFGAILLFESESRGQVKVEERWEGLEDVIVRSLSSSIHHCIQRFSFIHQIETLTRERNKMQEVLNDKLQLESNFESLLQSESAFKKQRDDLSTQVSVLNDRLRTLVQEKESSVASFQQEVSVWKSKSDDNAELLLRSTAAFEASMQQIQEELTVQRQQHATLMDVIKGYVMDSRCSSKDTVIDWLRDTAEYLKVSLAVVSQSESGDIDGFNGIRGAAAAVGEALRTGQTIEFSSSAAAKSSSKPSLRSSLTDIVEKGSKNTDRKLVNLEILCIPNRLVLSQTKHGAVENACFLFIREQLESPSRGGDGDSHFSQTERDILTCGTDLACRVLLKSAVKYSVEDFNRLETNLLSEIQIKNILRLSIKCAEKLLFREHNSKSELVRAIEDSAKSLLLSLSIETDAFNITVDTKLHFTPISTSAVINESSSSIEFEAMSKVLRSGRPLRKAGMLIVPISDAKSQICAILSCEKKLSAASSSPSIDLLERHHAELNPGGKRSSMPHITDLLMTDSDEEALSILCFLIMPLLDKLNCLSDAYSGIQQAGQAIVALQQINSEIEDKLASAIAQRVAIESTMQCGLDILSAHFKPRTTTQHIINVARAAIMSVTSSSHCFVVIPGEVIRKEVDEWSKLVTIDDETIVDVHLDDIDIESSILSSTKRAYNDTTDRLESNDSIHSWSARRVQSKRQHPQVSEFYYIQVIPLYVRLNGSENIACGFISTLRKAAKYSAYDKDGVSWVGQMLSLCLEQCVNSTAEDERLKATEEDIVMSRVSDYMVRIEQLEKEAKQLAKLESLRQVLEDDARILLEDLSLRYKNSQSNPMSAIEEEFMQETIQIVFGKQSTYKSWQYSNAIDAFEFSFQLDNLAKSSETSADSSFCKESVSFGNISATLWVDSGSSVLQSVLRSSSARFPQHVWGTEEESNLQQRLQGLIRTVQGEQYIDDARDSALHRHRHRATIVLLFKGSQKGESDRWMMVTSVTESLPSIKIRLCMMINILRDHLEWRKKVDQLNDSIYQSNEIVKNMEYKLLAQKEAHQSDVERGELEVGKIKEVCKVTLERAKDKYKSLVREVSQERSSVEGVLVEATAFCLRLRRQFKSRSGDQQWLHTALLDLAGTLSTLANIDISVGLVNKGSDAVYDDIWSKSDSIWQSKNLEIALTQCVSSERVVIAATETSKWETRLSTLYTLIYDKSSTHNNKVLILPNDGGDACFFPILFSSTSTKIFVVRIFFSTILKQHSEPLDKNTASANSHFFGALLVAWLSIKESVESMCGEAEEAWRLRERAQVAALKTIQMSCNLRTLREMVPYHVLEVLKSMRMRAKLKSALSNEPELLAKLHGAKFQVRNLERASADWKELVVGLNVSTMGIMEGIPGLWAKACRSLLSILSSSLSLRGCGLIILSNDSLDGKDVAEDKKSVPRRDRGSNRSRRKYSPADADMVELAVSELISASMRVNMSERSLNIPLPSYAKDVIEIRPVNESGQAVENLAWEIFNTGSVTQRIFKLSRTGMNDGDHGNSEERLWLVPIKGVHRIVGLLRVSFSLPREPFSPSTPISAIAKPMEFQSARRTNSNDMSEEVVSIPNSRVERVLETAENTTINFADMLGPLLHAASQLSKEQAAKLELQILAQNESAQQVAIRKDSQVVKHKLSVLLEVVENVGRALLHEVKALASNGDDEQGRLAFDWNISIEEYTSHIASALSAALHVRVKIVLESVLLIDQETLSFPITQANSNPKQPVDSIVFKDTDNNLYGYMTWAPMVDDAVAATVSHDSRATMEVLSAVGNVISGAITGAVRNLQLQLQVSKAKRSAQTTENALQLEQVVGFELQRKEEELSTLTELYRSLADILHQCLLFNAKLPLEMKSLQAEFGEIPIVEHRLSQSMLLLELLRGLCERLPRVVGDKSCLFSFAVVDGQLRVPTIRMEESPHERTNTPTASAAAIHNMAWVYSSNAVSSGAGSVSLNDLPQSAKEMASNLAQIALNKRQKSSFDITFPPDDKSTASVHYRIITIPLKNTTIRSKRKSRSLENIPLGVMQVFIDLAERKEEEIERLCEDIASAVSCALSQDVFHQQLSALLEVKDIQQQVAEAKSDDLANDVLKTQHTSKLWHAVSTFSVIIMRHTCALQFANSSSMDNTAINSPASRSLAQLIASEDVTSCLFDTGISLTLLNGEIDGTLSVQLGGDSNTYVSIQCTDRDSASQSQVLQSCAEAICSIIRSAVILEQNVTMGSRDSRKKDHHAAKLIAKLKVALQEFKQDTASLQAIVADQSRSLQFTEDSLASARQLTADLVPQYFLPTIQDFSLFLTAYCTSDSTYSDTYQAIAQVANEAMSQVVGRSEGAENRHHLSVLVRENNHHDNKLQLRAYTLTATVGHTTQPSGRSSVVSKCFASGGVHSKSIQRTSFGDSDSDFSGVDPAAYSRLFDSAKAVTVCCVSLPPSGDSHPTAILRLVLQSAEDDKKGSNMRNIFEQLLVIIATLSGAMLATHALKMESQQKLDSVASQLKKEHEQTLSALTAGSKMKKLQRGICREAISLLDPPMIDNGVGFAVHPATLTPIAASLDVCLKLLGMIRSLLRAPGQAILLKNPMEPDADQGDVGTNTSETGSVNSFQVIYTGDTLTWPGVSAGSFGLVAGSTSSSLVHAVMSAKEPLLVTDITADGRYCPLIDGVVAKGTSVLMAPVRGRGGTVVGVLIAAKPITEIANSSKKRGKAVSFESAIDSSQGLLPFSLEDVSVAETCAAMGALSLYWCQGLGSIQQNLRRSIDKMERLEATVQRLQSSRVPAAPSSGETAGAEIEMSAAAAAVRGQKVKGKSKGKIK